MNSRRGLAVAFALSLLIAPTLTVTPGYEDEDDGHGEFGEGDSVPPRKVTDEWETEEPHYEPPEWHMPEGQVQTLEFGGGDMNDADKWSDHMPMELKCDGCRAIAYAIKEKLKKFQKRYRERHIFSEADIVEMMDQVCQNKKGELDGYGVKEILGKRRLSGPGLETKEVPGVSHGGGKWGYRLQQMCNEYVNEIGEYTIYKRFLKHKSMENVLCRNTKSELGWICPKKRKRRKKKNPEPQEGEEEGPNQPAPSGENNEAPPQDSATESEHATQDAGQEQKQSEQDADSQPKDQSKQPAEDTQQSKERETKPGPGTDKPKAEDVKKSPKDEKAESTKNPTEKHVNEPEKDAAKPTDQDSKKPDAAAKKPKDDGETKAKEVADKPKEGSKEETQKENKDTKKPQEEADKTAKPEYAGKSGGDSKSSNEKSKQSDPGAAKDKQRGQSKEDETTPKEEL